MTVFEIASLKSEISNATVSAGIADQQSKADLEGLSTDIDTLTRLAQQIADALHQADVNAAAKKALAVVPSIAEKHGYTGPSLGADCDTREEVTNVLATLLQHLQTTMRDEIEHSGQVADAYTKYVAALNSQLVALEHIESVYSTQISAGTTQEQSIVTQLAEFHAQDANLAARSLRLDQLKSWIMTSFGVRSKMLYQLLEVANKVIQMINLLQAKLAVTPVSSK